MPVEFVKFKTYETLSQAAAKEILSLLENRADCNLGLATGYSPERSYALVAENLDRNPALVQKIMCFQLDEWLGISGENPASCQKYLQDHIAKPWKITKEQLFILDGLHPSPETQIMKMKAWLEQNPLDLCILGLGKNGHLALNEPGSDPDSSCRNVLLQESSTKHSMLKDGNQRVTHGITIGLKEIMSSKQVLLLVSGQQKEEAFTALVERSPVSESPASILHSHLNCKCFVDCSSVNPSF